MVAFSLLLFAFNHGYGLRKNGQTIRNSKQKGFRLLQFISSALPISTLIERRKIAGKFLGELNSNVVRKLHNIFQQMKLTRQDEFNLNISVDHQPYKNHSSHYSVFFNFFFTKLTVIINKMFSK